MTIQAGDNIEVLGILECGHKYCYNCILDWSKVSNHCPLCKKKFNKVYKIDKDAYPLNIEDLDSIVTPTNVTFIEDVDKDTTGPLMLEEPLDNCKSISEIILRDKIYLCSMYLQWISWWLLLYMPIHKQHTSDDGLR